MDRSLVRKGGVFLTTGKQPCGLRDRGDFFSLFAVEEGRTGTVRGHGQRFAGDRPCRQEICSGEGQREDSPK